MRPFRVNDSLKRNFKSCTRPHQFNCQKGSRPIVINTRKCQLSASFPLLQLSVSRHTKRFSEKILTPFEMLFNPKPLMYPANFRFPLQCIWLKFNGSWPLKPKMSGEFEKYFRLLYSTWAWYVVVMVGITIGFQSAFLVNSFGNIMVTTENGCTTFMGMLNFVRLLHLRLHQREFQQLLAQFVKDIWITRYIHMWREMEAKDIFQIF